MNPTDLLYYPAFHQSCAAHVRVQSLTIKVPAYILSVKHSLADDDRSARSLWQRTRTGQ